MSILKHKDITLDDVISDLEQRLTENLRNIDRVKKLYHDDATFDNLMNKIIEKDRELFQKFISAAINGETTKCPTPWRIFSIILDIVQSEGEELPVKKPKPLISINKNIIRRNIKYMGWTFHWLHGKNTLLSIYDRSGDLIYQF
ncbi:MAG TPA: hypothetical protein PK698_02445 [Bacilli bacterium]|jgi:hypothetical protein|nr:MAG: hypothetical protein BWX59_02361 [Bacteroidetes bacterium ADurb.Bin028]HOH61332.1 hypothetical protein [Bacilli bacterium]